MFPIIVGVVLNVPFLVVDPHWWNVASLILCIAIGIYEIYRDLNQAR